MKLRTGITFAIILAITAIGFAIGCGRSSASQTDNASLNPAVQPTPAKSTTIASTSSDEVFDGVKLARSEEEWKQLLTPVQFNVMREEGTDVPYKSPYHDNHEKGSYYCAACHLKIFTSKTKFESGTGWPSFYQVVNPKNVVEKEDRSLGEARTEVECARCGAHLGHVFDDGPKPTGLRYCMNGTALKFEKGK